MSSRLCLLFNSASFFKSLSTCSVIIAEWQVYGGHHALSISMSTLADNSEVIHSL